MIGAPAVPVTTAGWARRRFVQAAVLVCCSTLFCSARPGWIVRLPDSASPQVGGDVDLHGLVGRWVRTVDSRYGVGNPRAHSIGSETIVIESASSNGSSARYTKLHLYREQVGDQGLTRGYRETGTIARRGQYLLFTPERGESFGPTETQITGADDSDATHIQLPDPRELVWTPNGVPGALLFYYQPERIESHPNFAAGRRIAPRMTPLAYEAFGEIYDHGIYEGAEFPYDFRSGNFHNAVEIWNQKRNQPHGYVKTTDSDGT